MGKGWQTLANNTKKVGQGIMKANIELAPGDKIGLIRRTVNQVYQCAD